MNCGPTKRNMALIISNSALLATGILLIIFSCVIYETWWPLMMIFVFSASIIFPSMCDSCRIESSQDFADPDRDEIGPMLSWVFVGIFLVVGYAIPIELLRRNAFSLGGVYMSVGGGTIIIMAIILFVKIVFY